MGGQTISLNYSHESKRSCDSISILVVDDDITCLSIVAATLKKFNYEVVTAKHPNDALCALRIKGDAFDLVVSDVHMPDMNGFELKEAIAHEFNLPVVLMSADNKEGVVSKGLEIGAVFFISKPVSPDDVRDLWQFASMKRKTQVANEAAEKEITSANHNNSDDETQLVSASMVKESKDNKKDSKRKSPSKEEGCEERREDSSTESTSTMKKKKVIWTNALHNSFLEAIRIIGLERSVPKKILEVMNVPGLTRENVASHLQKYRIFLRRVSEASFNYVGDHKAGLNSSFASSRISLSNRFSEPHYENPASLLKPRTTYSNHIHHPSIRMAQNTYPIFQGHLSNASLQGHNDSFDHAPMHQMNYMGYKISNVQHIAAQSGSCREYGSMDSFNGTMNLHQIEFQNNSSVNGAPNVLSDNTLNLVQTAPILGSNSSSYEPENREGKQLSDVSSNYQNLSLLGNLGNEGLIHESPALTPMYHLSPFDNLMEADDLDNYFSDQTSIQNQAQQINEGENTGKNWDNHSSSYHQDAPNQHEDDDFLEALLALGSIGEDQIQTLDGI